MLETIDSVIFNMRNDLEIYVKKETVNTFIVNKYNNYIKQLFKIRKYLIGQNNANFHVLDIIQKKIEQNEKDDPELNGHAIVIQKSPGPNMSYIKVIM